MKTLTGSEEKLESCYSLFKIRADLFSFSLPATRLSQGVSQQAAFTPDTLSDVTPKGICVPSWN